MTKYQIFAIAVIIAALALAFVGSVFTVYSINNTTTGVDGTPCPDCINGAYQYKCSAERIGALYDIWIVSDAPTMKVDDIAKRCDQIGDE